MPTANSSLSGHRLHDRRVLMPRLDSTHAEAFFCGRGINPIMGRIALLQMLEILKYCSALRLALHPQNWISIRAHTAGI